MNETPEDRLADALQEQEQREDYRRNRFLVTITDTLTGQERSTSASDAFLALHKLRLDLGRPELVLTASEREPDEWSGR